MSEGIRRVALVAHDNKKSELIDWVSRHRKLLTDCHLLTTGTTGKLVTDVTGLAVERLQSGPLGGDQQIGARIAEGQVDLLIFFWDPLEPMSHDPDIKALLRVATLWNIPIACNESSADFIVSSPCFRQYERRKPDFSAYQNRAVASPSA
ncbi:methylglyoxal synthase [Marinobacter nanhaiticus D15-8W]|uniref:Methylglyoxal synthase n=1 Tax=Marinobacter nanhaiticus D15-8W TaxID=626887 RepID=N6WRA3_9GAMM|nr:methylglyoxal synthase [Marinobacter nanhaiticus]ENO13592.1 methylglyoxal synthase [Marinobacter nanhaiticus D15-8W]BES70963.1 methylglyoxal synthase [Marinobacter nanhaiticus D15-8W]